MRIAIVADSHFSERSRFDECIRIHDWIADYVLDNKVDLLLHAGDVFDAKSTPRERKAVADWLQRITLQCPVVIVRGNHDAVGDLKLFERLTGPNPIRVIEDYGIQDLLFEGKGKVSVVGIAWPRKAALLAATGGTDVHSAFRQMLAGFSDMMPADAVKIVLAHAMVSGSVTSTGQPLVGCDMEVGLADFGVAKGVSLFALGHIHKQQAWYANDANVIYPGSPRRTAYGETETKGFLLYDTDEDVDSGVMFIETPTWPGRRSACGTGLRLTSGRLRLSELGKLRRSWSTPGRRSTSSSRRSSM
jgi:exonuclease SbcD